MRKTGPISDRVRYLCFFDTETTGLDPNRHEIIEIAAIVTDRKMNEVGRMERKIIPVRLDEASPRALEVNGFDQDVWNREGVSLAVALKELSRLIPFGEQAIPIGHNIKKFDIPFVRRAFKSVGAFCPLSFWEIDTVCLALDYINRTGAGLENVRLETLSSHFGIKHENAHTALADVEANIEVYRHMSPVAA